MLVSLINTGASATITCPAGWAQAYDAGRGSGTQLAACTYVVTSSTPVSKVTLRPAGPVAMVTEAFSGINATNPVDAAGAVTGLVPPSVTTTHSDDLLVLDEGSNASYAVPSAPNRAALLTTLTNSSYSQSAVATEIASSEGATSTAAWSTLPTASAGVTGVVALESSMAAADPPQTITFTSTPPASPTVGDTYAVSATGGGSGNPVVFSIPASNSATCSISGSTVTFNAAGTCVVDANQASSVGYSAAPEVDQSFTVSAAAATAPKAQAINFTSTPPASPTVGGTYAVSATGGGSGNPVTFSIGASSTSGTCSISGSTVTINAAGTCVVDANQASSVGYVAAPEVDQSFTVSAAAATTPKAQAITFTSTPPASPTVGGTYPESATGGGSGNPVTFSIPASNTATCSISGSTVTFNAAGTCVVDANQASSVGYSAAPEVDQSFTVSAAAAATPGSAIPLGIYAGNNNLAGVESFASTTGGNVTLAETYLPWNAYTGSYYGSQYGWGYLTTEATLASWLSSWVGTSDRMVIGVPMVALDGSGNPENTLAQGAAGDENATFVAIATNLVTLGLGNAILRPGWEFDGNWYPWTVQSNTDAANFATYWQNIVTAMRSVPGAKFQFIWSPAGFQSLSWNINDAYPGNSYVDYVSEDVYDWSWDGTIFSGGDPNNTATVAQSNAVFNDMLTDSEGLNWLSSFAQVHGEPIVIPEWAVTRRNDGHGLGDDPTFINNMYNWLVTNHVAWSIYFIDDTTDNVNQGIDFLLTDGNFPKSLAALESDFG